MRELARRCTLTVGVDSVRSAERIGRTLTGSGLRARVEVDSGHHRTGCPPGEAGDVASALRGW